MLPEEIKKLVDRVRCYETDHIPDGWPAVQTKELTALADAIEYLKIAESHWREAYYEERAKYLKHINSK